MNKNDIEVIENSFRNFDKWETYRICFDALKSGDVTLGDIAVIAWNEAGITADVIKMRMLQMEKMATA